MFVVSHPAHPFGGRCACGCVYEREKNVDGVDKRERKDWCVSIMYTYGLAFLCVRESERERE